MSLISSKLSLTHRVTIQRNAHGASEDSWGNPEEPGWEDHLTDLPCRVWTASGQEVIDPTTVVVMENMHLLLPIGTDVTENDRISAVTYRGATIAAGPISIRAVMQHQDHLELMLVRLT